TGRRHRHPGADRPACADLRPDRGREPQGRQSAHRGWRRGRRPGRGGGGRGRQCGARQTAGGDRRQDLSRHRAVEGSAGGRGGTRSARAGARQAACRRRARGNARHARSVATL
ncbi:hypothetical protein XPR_4345, partial [Xanthomonas arboricola pv. pruni MAFF 301420]